MKLRDDLFRLNLRKMFLSTKVVIHWNREAVDASLTG